MIIKPKWLRKFLPLVKIIKDSKKEAKFVGGCVRDTILGKKVSDFDIATDASPQEIIEILEKNRIKVIPTGLKHGTVTAMWRLEPVEITTLRRDKKCDGRHAEIEFTSNWQEDAKRRDFTFNAMYLDIDGRVYDYFSGLEDLKNGRLNFVGDPNLRIEEDYLRILRAFRFHANFCTVPIDEEILAACTKFKDKIDTLSGERVRCEMMKLLSYRGAIAELIAMQNCGILQIICGFNTDFSKIVACDLGQDTLAMLALLIRNCDKSAHNALEWLNKRWKLTKKEYKTVKLLINSELDTNIKKNILDFGRYNTNSLVVIAMAEGKISYQEAQEKMAAVQQLDIAPFPVFGRDITPLGYHGKAIGQILNTLKQEWEKTDYAATKEELLSSILSKIK